MSCPGSLGQWAYVVVVADYLKRVSLSVEY